MATAAGQPGAAHGDQGRAQAAPAPAPSRPAQPAAAAQTAGHPVPGEPASSGSPEPEPSPLTSSDLAAGLRRLSGLRAVPRPDRAAPAGIAWTRRAPASPTPVPAA